MGGAVHAAQYGNIVVMGARSNLVSAAAADAKGALCQKGEALGKRRSFPFPAPWVRCLSGRRVLGVHGGAGEEVSGKSAKATRQRPASGRRSASQVFGRSFAVAIFRNLFSCGPFPRSLVASSPGSALGVLAQICSAAVICNPPKDEKEKGKESQGNHRRHPARVRGGGRRRGGIQLNRERLHAAQFLLFPSAFL